MARGKTASTPTRSKAKSSAKASTNTASRSTTARTAKASTASARRAGSTASTSSTASTGGPTYRELYAEAQRRDIKGRSSMDKAQLERVLNRKRGK